MTTETCIVRPLSLRERDRVRAPCSTACHEIERRGGIEVQTLRVHDVSRQDVVGSSPIDPKYYLRVVLRRKWLILTVFVLVVGSVSAWTLRQPKVYEAQASMIIDVTAPKFLDAQVQDVNGDSYSN